LSKLQTALGYKFKDLVLLDQALTHKSWGRENKASDNERLEFLGDAVLQMSISEMIYKVSPELSEGMMSKFRSALVSEGGLARVARRIELGDALNLGRGEEQTGGREKVSILADALEAVIAAVYLDSYTQEGQGAVKQLISNLFGPEMELAEEFYENADSKTDLQEWVQKNKLGTIEYKITEERGPDHEKEFVVTLFVNGQEMASGTGNRIKKAEGKAAKKALAQLKGELV